MKAEVKATGNKEQPFVVNIIPETYREAKALCESQGLTEEKWDWIDGKICLKPIQTVKIEVKIDD